MAVVRGPVDRSSREQTNQAPWPAKLVVMFVSVLVSALLGGTLVLSGHAWSRGGSVDAAAMASQSSPEPTWAANEQSFVGTVPDARSDELAITPVQSAGAAPD